MWPPLLKMPSEKFLAMLLKVEVDVEDSFCDRQLTADSWATVWQKLTFPKYGDILHLIGQSFIMLPGWSCSSIGLGSIYSMIIFFSVLIYDDIVLFFFFFLLILVYGIKYWLLLFVVAIRTLHLVLPFFCIIILSTDLYLSVAFRM